MIPESDLEVLQSFNGRGNIAVTAYLRLDTPQHRESAYDEFMQKMQAAIQECGPRPECKEAIKEDMEIVGLSLRTNGHRRQSGIAIFSCAAELFWRAYPLPVPVPTLVSVGPRFDVEPLRKLAQQHSQV